MSGFCAGCWGEMVEAFQWGEDFKLGLSGSLFRGVVIPEPPSEREVAAEGRRKEPCGTNDNSEEKNCISEKMQIQHPQKAPLHALSPTRSAGAPSRREPMRAPHFKTPATLR